jgi:hypothetical protein
VKSGRCNNNDIDTKSSTRPVFPLSTNFRALAVSNRDVLFPVINSQGQSGKGDGEGKIIQEDSNELTKNKQRNSADQSTTDGLVHIVNDDSNDGSNDGSNDATNTVATILSDYPEVDEVVLKLYDIFTRDPGVLVQIQIDRYLFAASSKFVAECGGDLHTCILNESNVASVFNLPDIIYILRQRLIRGSWANAMQETVCRYTIPGMQKSRWVTRQRKVSTTPSLNNANVASGAKTVPNLGDFTDDNIESTLSSVYINTMLGLLLGLYPKCSKRPGFTMRVRIVRAVRALLTSCIRTQTAFILRHVSLVRLSLVEYFANVLDLYCPVEYQLLQRHVDVEAYVNLCRSSCDLFRVNNLSEGMQSHQHNEPLDWGRLDQLAYKMTDKIIRSTRVETKLINYVPIYHKSIKKLVSSNIYKSSDSCDEFLSLVKGCAVACWHDDHSYIYQRMLADAKLVPTPGATNAISSVLDLNMVVSDIHSILRTSMLPANFVRAQVETLRRLYEHDTVPLLVVSKKRICLHCLLRIAPKQFVLEEKINGNVRMNLEDDTMFCNRCMSDKHMINIDLIGRLLRINQQYMYICIECGAVHEWRADGSDLQRCPLLPRERLKLRNELHNDDTVVAKSTTGKCRTHCFVCSKLCTGHGLWILHVASMRMIHFDLCSMHLPPLHMTKYIVDTWDYQRWLENTTTSAHKKKRRG